MFTDEQIAIINHTQGNAVTIAVAGSGKTSTLVERARNLTGTSCLIVYNKSAANDVQARYKKLGISASASTIHSLAFKRAGQNGLKIEPSRLVGVDGGPDMYRILFGIALGLKLQIDTATDWVGLPEIMAESLLNEHSSDEELDAITDLNPADVRKFIAAYRQLKRRDGLYDFSDLMQYCIDNDLAFNFDHVMLDEAQDATPLRIKFVERMMATAQSFVAVGDPAQGIYAYQGARPKWLLELADRPDFKVFKLSTSWRLPRLVASYSNQILPLTELGKLSSVNCRDGAPEGTCEVVRSSNLVADAGKRILEFGSSEDTLVLARTRLSLARLIKFTTQNNIPFRTLAPEALPWCSKLGQQVVGYLELGSGYATSRLREVANKPVRYIKGAVIQNVIDRCDNGESLSSVLSSLSLNDRALNSLRMFVSSLSRLTWDRKVERVRATLLEYVKLSKYDEERQEELKDFYNFLCDEAQQLSGIEELWDQMENEHKLVGDSKVPLLFSTIHRSKGLEAKNVILLGLSKEFPSSNAILADEAKIYYVACTRAKERLFVFSSYDGLGALMSVETNSQVILDSKGYWTDEFGTNSMHPADRADADLAIIDQIIDDRMFGN